MRLLVRPDTASGVTHRDLVRQRRLQLGLGYVLVPVLILVIVAASEAVAGETGWWVHLLQVVPIVGLGALAWARPLVGGTLLLAASVGLGTWLLLDADAVGDAMGTVVLLCGPMLVGGAFFMASGAPPD